MNVMCWKGNGMNTPLAYFLTFTCYGTWLHGDENGSVDRDHNTVGTTVLPPDAAPRTREQDDPAQPPYLLDQPRRQIALQALWEITRRKGWALHAAHVRSNHVHLIVTAEGLPERILNDVKTAVSRRLNKVFPAERNRPRWTRHGSTRYLWTEEVVAEKVQYVLEGQGEPMECYPSRARSAAE
jgi:REP element-mobilizing transposase RayT